MSAVPNHSRSGFTLVELLVVVALIVLLLSMVFLGATTLQNQARTTGCLSNQRQINLANFGFATDNNGTFMSPRSSSNYDSQGGSDIPTADCSRGGEEWRLFTKSYGSNIANISGATTERDTALTEGAGWDYLGDLKVYSSPLDPTNRLRSYALNAYVGELCPDNLTVDNIGGLIGSGWRAARTISMLPKPNRTLMTLCEEDHQGGWPIENADFNLHGWVVKSWETYQAWWDYPAPWLEDGTTLSFCDGSTSYYKYRTPNLGQELINRSASGSGHHRATYAGELVNQSFYDENNSDWKWFSNHMLPGVITP